MSDSGKGRATRSDAPPFDPGLYAPDPGPRFTSIEIIAAVLTVLWCAAFGPLLLFQGDEAGSAGALGWIMALLALVLPVVLIWVAASAARGARRMREEAARLQDAIDQVRGTIAAQRSNEADPGIGALAEKLEQIAAAQREAQTQLARLAAAPQAAEAAIVSPRVAPTPDPAADTPPQPSLGLGTPTPPLDEPMTVAEFVKALDFPQTDRDAEGFRVLRKALRDPLTQRLVRASQDVLTLLSQDGIYMDDLKPDRARPEVWRRFAHGERGRQIAGLGGVHDRSSLALASGRMKQDPVFRDAVHHFLRHFDHTIMEFERHATDEDIVRLADTRTARAFMLLGRVTGVFA
ncbi:hypothetical protein HKCCE3408_10190 [Rhodobacterales bacterium HKCCE3408]|nr:hypothetical protein [Rhodobacterales bacterium HKCCE3408]